ncbi:MAG: urea ABC transporter permease subunit UrtB [Thermaurantiacus tibetensis]|uniref:urea ABC transporter permease subunit UrtB n=1 Tax=Thermaurantiacus tibetensis TaxID=2759035 RepID=UPI00188E3B72|nr:urea ABC transporter permease subunit UrtB [Thermaurantiacus tibetensis]
MDALIGAQLFNGLSVASINLMAALGLALVFGLMRVINMAHGEFLMLGGYLAFLSTSLLGPAAGVLVSLLVASVGAAVAGAIVHLLVVRHLLARPLDTLLATWGLALILQQLARDLFGPIGVEVALPAWLSGTAGESLAADGDGLALPASRLFILAAAAAVLGVLHLALRHTRLGLAIRAVSQDRMMAAALGIDVRRVELAVFALGAGLAGLGGVLLALLGPVTPTVGQAYVVPAFLVVILGGIGSLGGTAAAALLLGLVSALAQVVVDVAIAQLVMLLFVILFLQLRPEGLVVTRSRALDA